MRLCRLATCLLAFVPALFAQKKPVTLESIRTPRLPDLGGSPVWAPDGKSFLVRKGAKLVRYDAAARQEREIVDTATLKPVKGEDEANMPFTWENRRAQEQALQWSGDGSRILLVQGGDLFLITAADGKAVQLTSTAGAERDPKLSPNGKRISFRREHDLYVTDVDTKKETRLTRDGSATLWNAQLDWVYPEELDLGTAHWWSPDSESIAFLQFDLSQLPQYPHAELLRTRSYAEPQRYPQAGEPNSNVRLGVIPAAGGNTKWMDLGETRDTWLIARVYWAPDSKSLYVQRLNRIQNRLDLLRADTKTGAAVEILRETDPYWINLGDDFQFLANGRKFLWSSERDGFRHLYLYSADGREWKQLTKGQWIVTDTACVDETNQSVYYISTDPSPLERHFYKAPLDGSAAPVKLTQAKGTHTVTMGPGCQYYLDSHSSLTSPSRRTLHDASGKELGVYREADRKAIDEFDILPTEIVSFKTKDGAQLYARLIKPKGLEAGRKYPVIVSVYGGPHAQAVRDAWAGLSWDQVMAHKGYVIWQLDNRGSANRGHAFEAAVFRKLGTKELEDQREGVEHLISMGFADPERIGIQGWSYGGFMTTNAMLNAADMFKAGIAGAPVTNFRLYDTIYTERYMGLPSENPDGYASTNLSLKAGNLKGSLLLVHNFEDDNVLFQNMLTLTDALQRAGRPFELMIYPQKAHGVAGPYRAHLNELMTNFFDRALAPAKR